jgi:perosamine synthetase
MTAITASSISNRTMSVTRNVRRDAQGAANRFVTEGAEVPFWHVEIGEAETAAVLDTIARKRFSMGPVTRELEAEIARQLEVPYVLCVTSGSTALTLACMAAGIGPGDEVIVPTRTFIATAHAPLLLGAKVVLVDCLRDSPVLDIDEVRRKITARTKAIMPVHLNGRGADMHGVLDLARKHGLAVIEDACQGLFCRHEFGYHGTIGDAGAFSFSMVKLVATGQGGAVVTRRKDLYETLYRMRNHGVADVVSHTYLGAGSNFKMSDIQASIGLQQIRRREQKVVSVNATYRRYREALAELPFIEILPVDVEHGEVALWTEVMCAERERLMDFLSAHGVQSRKFLPCCHSGPHFATAERFPNSERFARTGLNLPCGPDLPMAMVERTIDLLKTYEPAGLP